MLARRRQIQELLVAEGNRLRTARPVVRPRLAAHIAWLQDDLAAVDRELAELVRASPVWRE